MHFIIVFFSWMFLFASQWLFYPFQKSITASQVRLFNIASINSPKPNDGRYNYRYEVSVFHASWYFSLFICPTFPTLDYYRCIYLNLSKCPTANPYLTQVHYPEDGKYTIDLLKTTRRGGRDPVTGTVALYSINFYYYYSDNSLLF